VSKSFAGVLRLLLQSFLDQLRSPFHCEVQTHNATTPSLKRVLHPTQRAQRTQLNGRNTADAADVTTAVSLSFDRCVRCVCCVFLLRSLHSSH